MTIFLFAYIFYKKSSGNFLFNAASIPFIIIQAVIITGTFWNSFFSIFAYLKSHTFWLSLNTSRYENAFFVKLLLSMISICIIADLIVDGKSQLQEENDYM